MFSPGGASWHERIGVITLVLVAHGAAVLVWIKQPEPARFVLGEMAVTVALPPAKVVSPPVLSSLPSAKTHSSPKPLSQIAPDEQTRPQTVEQESVKAPPVQLAVPLVPSSSQEKLLAPVVDTEPDYQAEYLNNPRPAYPVVARRMGWQGRVVLNVEVLVSGFPGQIKLLQSSGHDVLDNAAINAVKGWRFVPGRQSGHLATQWVHIPIPFILKDSDA